MSAVEDFEMKNLRETPPLKPNIFNAATKLLSRAD